MLNEQPETVSITAASDAELWAILQPPATETPFELNESTTLTEDEPIAPLPWSDPEIAWLRQEIERLEDHLDRSLLNLRQDIDHQKNDLEQVTGNIRELEIRLEELEFVSRRSRCLVTTFRIIALLALGMGAIAFIGAGLSGSPQQKDQLAEAAIVVATVGVGAAAIGSSLD
jgi:hypothetical protein